MALDPVPWLIGGGAEHGPEVARMLAYAATAGSEGIITATDLRVTALPTPGAAVRVYPGGAALLNRYPGAPNQSYTVRNASATDVAIPATGAGSGATRYVILRVDDPQYGGQVPPNVVTGPYVRFALVNSITDLAYPFIVLARINQPANTSAITGAMITDLRAVSNPKTHRELYLQTAGSIADLTNANMVRWPNVSASVPIPEWATSVKAAVRVDGALQMVSTTVARLQVVLGSLSGPVVEVDINSGASSTNPARATSVGAILSARLPVAMRGTSQTLELRAQKINPTLDTGYLRADTKTHTQFDIWFTQEVE